MAKGDTCRHPGTTSAGLDFSLFDFTSWLDENHLQSHNQSQQHSPNDYILTWSHSTAIMKDNINDVSAAREVTNDQYENAQPHAKSQPHLFDFFSPEKHDHDVLVHNPSVPLWQVALSVVLLFLNYFLAQYDKFILSYFQSQVITSLGMNLSKYGILSGYATGIVYALLAIPV